MKKKLFISFIILFIMSNFLSIISYADDSTTRSIIGDFFNKVFDVSLDNGAGLFSTQKDFEKREEINNNLLEGKDKDKTYSLYDRFGGQIKFVPYFGETKISTNLLDRFYTKFNENVENFGISFEDIASLFSSSAISNNVVYDGRPNILSSDNIENGCYDPRVAAYSGVSSVGGDASLGNLFLSISNFFTQITAYLSGSNMFKSINDIFIQLCDNGLSDILPEIVNFILPVVISVFVVFLVKKSIDLIKGKFSFRRFILQILSCACSLGFIFSFMYNPTLLSETITTLATSIDDILDKALSEGSNEVVKSDDTSNIRTATLWKKSVLEPWCEGMFGYRYEHLYTQYETTHNDVAHQKLPQDHDDVFTDWSSGEKKFNSQQLTGDIKVPLGNKDIRNWAALAWSCQSIYHIDAVEDSYKGGISLKDGVWPEATVTPVNNNIYADNFRWLDAKLNISPEYISPDNVIQSYSNSNNYKQSFISSGLLSLWSAILLLPIFTLSIKKVGEAILLIFSTIKLMYYSIMNFIMPNEYDFIANIKKILSKFYDYLWWCIVIFLAINIYSVLEKGSLIIDVIWVFIGIYLNKFKPIRSIKQVEDIKNKIKIKAKYVGEKAKNTTQQLNNKIKSKLGKN